MTHEDAKAFNTRLLGTLISPISNIVTVARLSQFVFIGGDKSLFTISSNTVQNKRTQ